MKLIPKIFPGKNKHQNFVVLDLGLGRVNIAIFKFTEGGPKFVGVGRRSFTEADTKLDATLEATDALGAIVDELPRKAIVGVAGGSVDTLTTVAAYTREKPNQPINKEEIENVLKRVSEEGKKDLKIFFSTIIGSKIDGSKITNPNGVKGEKAEISCFVAFKPEDELDIYEKIIEELELKPEKILPSTFAVAKMMQNKISPNSLLVRVGQNKSEVAETQDSHLSKILNFDLGIEQIEFYCFALEAILENQEVKNRATSIWLYSDSDEIELEELKKKIEEEDWKKKFKINESFKVGIIEGEDNFGPADIGLLALSLEEINKL